MPFVGFCWFLVASSAGKKGFLFSVQSLRNEIILFPQALLKTYVIITSPRINSGVCVQMCPSLSVLTVEVLHEHRMVLGHAHIEWLFLFFLPITRNAWVIMLCEIK